MVAPNAAPAFIPASRAAEAITFVSVDALAVHLLRQRPGRRLDLLPQMCTRDGAPEFPVVAVFAMKPRAGTARAAIDAMIDQGADPLPLQDEWLGWAAGDRACELPELQAALHRMRSAGGLAA